MPDAIAIREDAAEVLLGEAQAVRSMVRDDERRARLADLIASVGDGEVAAEDADALAELLELGLETGRIRALYGPAGEQAALGVFRRLPRGREAAESARAVSGALASLAGEVLERVDIQAPAPGSFLLTIAASGRELSIRLDRHGARVTSVGT